MASEEEYELVDGSPEDVQDPDVEPESEPEIVLEDAVRESGDVPYENIPDDDEIGALFACADADAAAEEPPEPPPPPRRASARGGPRAPRKVAAGGRDDTLVMRCTSCDGKDRKCEACFGLGELEVALRASITVAHKRTPCCAAPWMVDPKKPAIILCSNCKNEYRDGDVIKKG